MRCKVPYRYSVLTFYSSNHTCGFLTLTTFGRVLSIFRIEVRIALLLFSLLPMNTDTGIHHLTALIIIEIVLDIVRTYSHLLSFVYIHDKMIEAGVLWPLI